MNSRLYLPRPLTIEPTGFFIKALLVYYMLYRMPIVSHYVNTYLTMVLLGGLFVLFFVMRGNRTIYVSLDSISLVPAYVIFLVDFCYTKNFDVMYSAWSFFLFILPIFIGRMIVDCKYKTEGKILVYTIMIVYFVTAVTTFRGLSIFPDASRLLATGGDYHKTFSPYNIGGYQFVYSLVLLHPLMVGVLRKKGKLFFAIIYSLVTLLCVIRSAYTIALLLFMISLISYSFPINNRKKFEKKWLILICLIILFLLIFSVDILNALASWDVLNEDVAQKIADVSNILQGKDVDGVGAESRQRRYIMSFDAIKENFLIGSRLGDYTKEGGHSFILDTIAKWGVIGFIFVSIFFVDFLKWYKKITSGSVSKYYAILFVIMTITLSALNPTFWEFELGLIAPLMFCILSEKDDKELD